MLSRTNKKGLLFVLAASLAMPAFGQSTTQGSLVGTVQDTTGAAVPNAKILVHNNATNAEQTLTSDGAGFYKAPLLQPGTYTVTVDAQGFQELKSNNVTVEVNVATEFDPKLQVGEATQTVTVTAAAPVLDFESPTYGGHLENQEIENIPINNRRWSALALLTPGVTSDTSGFGLISFRAISPVLNNVQVDGADDNQAFFSEERGRTRAGYSTSQAMVREFQVNTGVYSAEYGRAVGGVINSVTKSGGNEIHGEAYFYNRKSSRAAFQPGATNTVFDSGTGKYVTSPYKPADNRNQFGFEAGGPLVKDRLFWAYAFDMYRRNFPGTAKANNPSTFFVDADTTLPSGQTCLNTTVTVGTKKYVQGSIVTGSGGSTAAAGTTADNGACLLAQRLYSGDYTAGATNYNAQLQALLPDLGKVPRFGNQEINTPKLDWQITPKEHFSVLYHRLRWDSPGGVQTQGTNNYAIDTFGTDFVKLDYGLAELQSQLTNRLTNELRFQYGRELNAEGQQPYSDYTKANLTGANGNVPEVNLNQSQGFYMGSPYYSYRVAYPDERKWQVGDTAAFVVGQHTLRFGEDIVHNNDVQNNLYESNGYFTYNSSANYFSDLLAAKMGKTTGVCDSAGSTTGSLPCYGSLGQSFGQPSLAVQTTDYGFFFQDDWKALPNLTLDLGVRYDYETLPAPFAANAAAPQTNNLPSDKNNISPRVGLAWDPFKHGRTTIHAGAGLYYGRIFNALLLNALENTGDSTPAGLTKSQALFSFSPSTAGAPLFPNIATTPPGTTLQPSIEYLDKNLQEPYTIQYDFAVQQELGRNTVLSVSYLGANGRELPNYLNVNLDPSKTYTLNYTVAPANGTTDCGPAVCGTSIPVAVYANRQQTGSSASSYNYVLLNNSFNGITNLVSNINSSYNALTAEVQKRQSRYFSFDVNYTWSHALDYNQTTSTTFTAGNNNWFDPYANGRANYANSLLNVPHRVVAWALINLPGTHGNGALSYLTNGWSLKPLLQTQSGLPYSVLVTGSALNQCSVAGCLEGAGSGLAGTGVTYIPAFGRNTRKYPITVVNDLRIQKDFGFDEDKYSLQLIGEAFNLPNHRNVTGVSTTGYSISGTPGATPSATNPTLVYQSSFGNVTNANSNNSYQPRQIQIAVRLVF